MAPQTVRGATRTLGSVVGGYRLGSAPAPGAMLRGYGYRAGSGDRAVGCVSPASYTGGYPTFACRGMTGGVSGSPLLTTAADGSKTVTGVIGGRDEGGCYPDVSYSSPFGAWSTQLLQRAVRRSAPDVVRVPRGSC